MIEILPVGNKLQKKINKFGLRIKIEKQLALLSINPSNPNLNTELLVPNEYGIYSFRIDRKYRAIFIFRKDKNAIEIINITSHYQ